jgi:AraC-like DNA-binding protein
MDVVSTDAVPAGERFAYWREVCSKLYVPYDIHCDPRTESGFRARVAFSAFGPVRSALATVVPHGLYRTTRRIRQAAPEVFELTCTVRGGGTATQDGRSADLGVGDLVLLDPSRPYRIEPAGPSPVSRVMLLHFPRSLLPLPSKDLRELTAVRIAGDRGVGALSSEFLLTLARRMPELSASDAARLSTLTVEVLTTALAQALDSSAPPRTRALVARILAFVRDNLGDPRLTPDAIAAAHHISLRYLHKLFHQEGHTVAGYIRERRLEHCRRDLADPRLAGRPIQAIAARWGFTGAAHFSQSFRNAYGVSPRQFRRCAQHEQPCTQP